MAALQPNSKITETKDIRAANRILIMRDILSGDNIARVDISQNTGLNKATVSTIVKELIELSLIEESEMGSSSGGRRPVFISPKVSVGYSIAVDISINSAYLSVFDLSNTAIYSDKVRCDTEDFIQFFTLICGMIDSAIAVIPECKYGLVGIGVAVKGIVNLSGIIKYVPRPDWRNIDIGVLLNDRYNVPVSVDNDGNFTALAEKRFFPSVNDMIVITIDDVITSGILLNGMIVKGFLGYANAIGHHVIDYRYPIACSCGKKGCLEQFCSNRAIIRRMNEYKKIDTIEEFIELVRAKNLNALDILESFISYLTIGISNMIFLLNIEVVVLNSPILEAFPYLLDHIHERLLLPITKVQKIYISSLQKKAPLLGASSRVIDNFYSTVLSGGGV